MKKKRLETILYSGAGIGAMLLILVAVNFIAAQAKQRIDLTPKRPTPFRPEPGPSWPNWITPAQIRFYCTKDTKTMPVALANYASEWRTCSRYRQRPKGKIEIHRLDPTPILTEDSARLDGVEAQPLRGGERAYLGLSVSMLDQKPGHPPAYSGPRTPAGIRCLTRHRAP